MAFHLLESGVDIYVIRNRLGHSSVETTEVYARASPQLIQRALLSGGLERPEEESLPDWSEDPTLLEYLNSINEK